MSAKKIVYTLAVISVVLLGVQGVRYYQFLADRQAYVVAQGQETTERLKQQVDTILRTIVTEGNRLAELFGANQYSRDEIEEIIKESARSIPELQGVTACFEPFAFAADRRLYCPYYDKGSSSYIQVEDSYDYTVIGKGTAWYTGARDKGAQWAEPYYANAAKDWYIDYGVPFYYTDGPNEGKVRGTITMSFVAGGFKNMVHQLSLGRTGYGIIASKQGNLLAHPHAEYIGVKDLAFLQKLDSTSELVSAYRAMQNRQVGVERYFDTMQKDQAYFYHDTIPASGWSIGLVFYKNDLLGDMQTRNRMLIQLAIIFSLFLVFILASYFIKDYLDEGEIWTLSILSSLLLLGNLVLVGYLEHSAKEPLPDEQTAPIVDVSALGKFIYAQESRAEKLKVKKPTAIPTGMYLHRMEFEDSYNLNLGGKVWQKYPLDLVDDVEVGFQFPQMSPFAEASYIEEAYRDTLYGREGEQDFLLVGWDVRVTLTLRLEYQDYPFDKRKLSIQFAPLNSKDKLIFVPDLAGYTYTNPSRKSGLDPSIVISGNEILESYYNYAVQTFESDFGYGNKTLFEQVPTLHFNVHLKRNLLNAFVTYLIPIAVTLLMMFILIYAVRKTAERQGIIESMAAFFFVLIFSHIDMRKEIVTADLIYLEFFYFITYLMVILSTANLVVYTKDKSDIFDFNENQVYKAIYFPLFLLLILVVTLVKFY